MLAKKKISIPGLVLKIAVAWALIAFVVYPVVSLLIQTFWHNGTLSTARYFHRQGRCRV